MLKLLFISLLTCCVSARHAASSAAQDQGIEGTVFGVGGNLMPAPNRKRSIPKDGIPTTLYIYELTNISQVDRTGQSPYYRAIHTRLIKQADTDEKGHFRVPLPAGHYSVFTKKNDLFYASRRDEKNNLSPVEVLPGKMTKIDCSVESDIRPVY
jgi:hypothetical protein